jgi:hypothetical protein
MNLHKYELHRLGPDWERTKHPLLPGDEWAVFKVAPASTRAWKGTP